MKAITATLILSFFSLLSFCQQGTYKLMLKSGAWCSISIRIHQKKVTSEVFAWWNTASESTGSFSGTGTLANNRCTLVSSEDSDCQVQLSFSTDKLSVRFDDCMSSNLPPDFSGTYNKLTDRIPGSYLITSAKTYFYKTAGTQHRLKSYLIKGNKVSVELENIKNKKWIFVNYTNSKGETSSGYLLWTALK